MPQRNIYVFFKGLKEFAEAKLETLNCSSDMCLNEELVSINNFKLNDVHYNMFISKMKQRTNAYATKQLSWIRKIKEMLTKSEGVIMNSHTFKCKNA